MNFSCFYYKIGKEGEHEERAAMKKEIEKKIQEKNVSLKHRNKHIADIDPRIDL